MRGSSSEFSGGHRSSPPSYEFCTTPPPLLTRTPDSSGGPSGGQQQQQQPESPPPSYEFCCLRLFLGPDDLTLLPRGRRAFFSYVCVDEFTGGAPRLVLATVGPFGGVISELPAEVRPRARDLTKRFIQSFGIKLGQWSGLAVPSLLARAAAVCPEFGEGLRDVAAACDNHRQCQLRRQRQLERRLHVIYLVDCDRLAACVRASL